MIRLLNRWTDPETRHPFFDQMEKLLRNRTGVAGLVIIAIFVFLAVFAPFISPHDPVENSLYDQLIPPVWEEGGTAKHILRRMTWLETIAAYSI